MKLNLGINKISAYVYANRTFKEDIMLFYNDISLKKCLSTDNIVKIECKLYNSDRMHCASLFLDMQRIGETLPMDNFMADFIS